MLASPPTMCWRAAPKWGLEVGHQAHHCTQAIGCCAVRRSSAGVESVLANLQKFSWGHFSHQHLPHLQMGPWIQLTLEQVSPTTLPEFGGQTQCTLALYRKGPPWPASTATPATHSFFFLPLLFLQGMIAAEGPTMARRKRASPRLGTPPARLANHHQQERGTIAKMRHSSHSAQPVFQGGIAPPGPGGPGW